MRKINKDEFKEFEIENGIFVSCFSPSKVIKIKEFLAKKIEDELNKSFDFIDENDVTQIIELILKLNTSEILYSVMALLEYYPLDINKEDKKSNVIQKLLINSKFEKYRIIIDKINSIGNFMCSVLELTDDEVLVIQSEIENFEQENNITILYDDEEYDK